MTSASTIFNGKLVTVDAMIIIKFHALLALDKFIDWAKREIVVEKRIKSEAKYSKAGQIDLASYIENNLIIEEEIEGKEQENLFYHYLTNKSLGVIIYEGEAACLALAISKGYGLACDEKVVRDEFKRKCPGQICTNSWGIVSKVRKIGLIGTKAAEGLLEGLHQV